MDAKKAEPHGSTARALLGKLGIKGGPGQRHVLPAAVGIASGVLAGAVAIEVVCVGVVTAGYVFTRVAGSAG